MIDRSLNYGRHHVRAFLRAAGGPLRVLDVGAGAGDDLLLAREANPRAELHALEIDPAFARRLNERGVRTHAVDIERDRFPFDDACLDAVIANQILEHTKELFWVLHEVSRALAVGGHLVLGVPNLASLHNRLLLAAGLQPTPIQNSSAHIRGFTKRDLLRLLENGFPGGYRLRAFGGSNFYPFPPMLARPLAALLPSMAWGIFLLLQKTRPYAGDGFLEYPIAQDLQTNFYLGEARRDWRSTRRRAPAEEAVLRG
jgi:SAM-dependent methyltransferase